VLDTEVGEAREVPVVGDPFASRLDRQRGEVRVGHEVPRRVRRRAELPEQLEVTSSGSDHDAVVMTTEGFDVCESSVERSRLDEDPGMGDDPDDPAQNELRDPER
jgi:hypothetical protein